MKRIILLIITFSLFNCNSTKNKRVKREKTSLEIINLANSQLSLMNDLKNKDKIIRDSIFLKKIYSTNLELWNNYLGDENDFLKWLNNVSFPELNLYQETSKNLKLDELNEYFIETSKKMKTFTGYEPKGKWYIVFGPKWTDAGGFGNGTMVLDLANSKNSLKHIKLIFPHELNHQIYSHTLPSFESVVLKRIINEGFATYVSYLFHNKETSISQELHYSEEELKTCIENEEKIMVLLKKHYKSNDKDIANLFANRNYKIEKNFPGAIGYYIGFRIVEEFIKKNGKDSWKKIYKITPEKVLEDSGILN